ncbi:Beta-glucuronidase [Psilocybe cubensis]|uniref:Beta-glucuronidase C-terminal domain-containing protein n=2 Tax=Psilocybe cubensis TaxID=181762 RepID=A0A8H7XTR5_PSICU|nr:Beta-glucuronidase [Psilocybe cubensis]KAH9476924.1 Beta-glucuronidase [Psilocybe cubensis]
MTTSRGTTLPAVFLLLSFYIQCALCVTVYYQPAQSILMAEASQASVVAAGAKYTGLPAYNPVVLEAPPPPGPSAVPTAFTIPLTNAPPPLASKPLNGSFFGFSVEMSFLQVPFLNLMANLQSRTGRVNIRVGGNTQETATLVNSTPDGLIIEKDYEGATNPTLTPPLVFTPELLYMLRNISSHVNVRWHLGVPFNDTSNFRLQIVEQGQEILGDYLIGLQVGNEPDLYPVHGHRPPNYAPQDYFNDFGLMVNALQQDTLVSDTTRSLLIGPSVQVLWTPEQVWDTGFIPKYNNSLAFLSVERDNCAVAFPGSNGTFHDPQQTFPSYLTHDNAVGIVQNYLPSTALAQQSGKEFLMFETNTASCGGFPGISDSFGAALWGVDYALQMAAVNFSGALFHVGGQSVSYNPFTPPPTNESTFHQWTVGPIYYSSLVVAEALGPTNTSQVMFLEANNNNSFTPSYGIWENGRLARVAIINFISDNTTASDLSVSLNLDGPGMPNSVQVKYLSAPSVSHKGNMTWANQTFGNNFESDGRPMGTEVIETVNCSPVAGANTNTCVIKVPAPAAALVFLSPQTDNAATPSTTFATTAYTLTRNTVGVASDVLATSNGRGGPGSANNLGSTSANANKNAADRLRLGVAAMSTVTMGALVGAWWVIF